MQATIYRQAENRESRHSASGCECRQQRELERWETAFDQHREGDPDEYHVEIRVAEERLRSARIREKRLIALRLSASST
jgi:hypothetical protein